MGLQLLIRRAAGTVTFEPWSLDATHTDLAIPNGTVTVAAVAVPVARGVAGGVVAGAVVDWGVVAGSVVGGGVVDGGVVDGLVVDGGVVTVVVVGIVVDVLGGFHSSIHFQHYPERSNLVPRDCTLTG